MGVARIFQRGGHTLSNRVYLRFRNLNIVGCLSKKRLTKGGGGGVTGTPPGYALDNKHLMTGPKGNSEFCFPETLNVPRGEAEGNIEVEGKQNSLFPGGPVIKCFVIPPNSK